YVKNEEGLSELSQLVSVTIPDPPVARVIPRPKIDDLPQFAEGVTDPDLSLVIRVRSQEPLRSFSVKVGRAVHLLKENLQVQAGGVFEFLVKLPLQPGENRIHVQAQNEGNESQSVKERLVIYS